MDITNKFKNTAAPAFQLSISFTAMAVLKIASIFASSIAFVANFLVCHVIVRVKTMKTSVNYIILNLAILDAISGILGVLYVLLNDNRGVLRTPVLHQAYNKSSAFAEVLCRVQRLYWIGVAVSPFLLVAMAFERYKAIAHPFSRIDSEMIKARLRFILPLISMLASVYGIFDMILTTYDKTERTCIDSSYSWFNASAYNVSFMVTNFVLPSIAIFILYLGVICALRRQDNALGPQAEAERARRKAKRKVMWIIIVVTLVFYICCGIPHFLLIINDNFHLFTIQLDIAQDIYVFFTSFNSAFNPFIYFIFIQSFRKGLKQAFMTGKDSGVSSLHSIRSNHTSFYDVKNITGRGGKEDPITEPQLVSLQLKKDTES